MHTCRLATADDSAAIEALMALSIERLQAGFLTPKQIAASRAVMGLDTGLIADRTYLAVEQAGTLIGCGGWSRRATLFGGDHTAARDERLLDPACEPARVRAMYTHPDFARQGIGRLILAASERAAAEMGFLEAELAATLAGVPLYRACGWTERERFAVTVGTVPVPLVRMTKRLR